jgi:hypothetical protein
MGWSWEEEENGERATHTSTDFRRARAATEHASRLQTRMDQETRQRESIQNLKNKTNRGKRKVMPLHVPDHVAEMQEVTETITAGVREPLNEDRGSPTFKYWSTTDTHACCGRTRISTSQHDKQSHREEMLLLAFLQMLRFGLWGNTL